MARKKSVSEETEILETGQTEEEMGYGSEYAEAQPEEEFSGETASDIEYSVSGWEESDTDGGSFQSEAPFMESGESAVETEEAEDPEYAALLQEMSENGLAALSDSDVPLVLEDTEDDGAYAEPVPESNPAPEPEEPAEYPERDTEQRVRRSAPAQRPDEPRGSRVLTIDARDEVQTEAEREAVLWHEIQNAHWTRRILTGTLDGVEQTESGMTVATVSYKGFRVAIPVKEMMLHTGRMPNGDEYLELMNRMRRILTARLGSEIDFIIMGHENRSRSVVGSRRAAMYRKRQSFYLDTNEMGQPMIYEGRVVQARVVAVAEKKIRVEIFGVECAIAARNLSDAWIGSASDHYDVGDRILVRILSVSGSSAEDLEVSADVRSVAGSAAADALKKCVPQGRYAGKVTDIRNGVVFIRLNNGANAIAHSCYDRRTPGKRDDVSFSVTRLDEEQGVAVGIITRIIKQNL